MLTDPFGTNNETLLVQSPYSGSSMCQPPGAGSVNNTLNCTVRAPVVSAYISYALCEYVAPASFL